VIQHHIPRAVLVLAVPALLLCARPAASGDNPPLPSAEEVIQKVQARATDAAERQAVAQHRYVQRTVIDKLDEKGHIREHEERMYDVGPLTGGVYARLVQKNGRSLTPTELREEHEREQRFRERDKAQKFGGGDSDRVPLDAQLFQRYKAEVVSREVVDGRPALVLHFWPRSTDLPIRRRQDYVLNKLTGQVWVDEQDWVVVKVEAHTTERVRVLLGLLATLDRVELAFQQMRLADDIYLPLRLTASFQGRKLFTSLHENVQVDWTGQRSPQETAGAPAAQAPANGSSPKPRP
jgi:hypothetical protein